MDNEHLKKIFNPTSIQCSTRSLKKIGPGVSEEKSFKGVDGQTDGQMEGQMDDK